MVYRLEERAIQAKLGVTIHAGEFSSANLMAALRTPRVVRLGYSVYAASDPKILETLVRSHETVKCCWTCNILSGSVSSYEKHPIRSFMAASIPVPLNTDLPFHLHTTIGREYTLAAELGISMLDLVQITRHAIQASFTADARRSQLLDEVHA